MVYPGGGGAHCFACEYHEHGENKNPVPKVAGNLKRPMGGVYRQLKSRGIDEQTCRFYGYRLTKGKFGPDSRRAKWNGKTLHVADYWRDGKVMAQHIRYTGPKDFGWNGGFDVDTCPLWGQHLWSGKGKRIVVTEGEIDCMTVAQQWKCRWPVVSIPSGTKAAEASIRANLEFLSGYDEIVIAFDNDEPGNLAAQKCAEILPPGKVKIVQFPEEFVDPNKMLLANRTGDILPRIYEAKSFQPDGILHASDIRRERSARVQMWTWPWDCLTRSLMGMRSGEMTLIASGTGSGKSTWCKELAYHHAQRGRKVGLMMLEENPVESMDDLISLHLNKPVRQIMAARELNEIMIAEGKDPLEFPYNDNLEDEELLEAEAWFKSNGFYVYDHNGTQQYGNILQRVEYLAAGLQCDLIFVDHITAVASDIADQGGERQCIDHCMKTFRSIVERTGTHIVVISQLNRLDGKAAEEGGQISLKNLRGSGALGFWPNNILAIERDQQAEDPDERKIVRVRALKGRFTGDTGIAGTLKFNTTTRRLEEVEWTPPIDGDDDHDGSTFEPEAADLDDLAGGLDEPDAGSTRQPGRSDAG